MEKKTKIALLLVVMVLTNMMAYIFFMAADIAVIINPYEVYRWNETIPKFLGDSGKFLLISQDTIIRGIDTLKADGDLNYMDRVQAQNYILGGLAFSLLLPLLMMSFIGFIIRGEETSLITFLFIFIISFAVIGVLQVFASWTIFGQVIFPYKGLIYFIQNIGVFMGSWFVTAPADITGLG